MTMFDFNNIAERPVKPEVAAWMKKYGTNHVTLLNQWKEDEAMHGDYDLLLDQLAYALQQRLGKVVIERILGRIKKVRATLEKDAFDGFELSDIPDVLL